MVGFRYIMVNTLHKDYNNDDDYNNGNNNNNINNNNVDRLFGNVCRIYAVVYGFFLIRSSESNLLVSLLSARSFLSCFFKPRIRRLENTGSLISETHIVT